MKLKSLIEYVRIYCNSYHRLYENAQFGDGKMFYQRKLVATYTTKGEQPHFTFTDALDEQRQVNKLSDSFEERQFIFKPFMECDPYPLFFYDLPAIIGEARKAITFDDALAIRFIRDKHNSDWSIIASSGVAEKLIKVIDFDGRYGSVGKDIYQHIGMCMIRNI